MKESNYKWVALSCSTLGSLFPILSGSTLTVALPNIMKDLNTDMTLSMWTIMSYMLIITIFVPAIGRLADMVGRKKLFVSGFIVFTIGSVLCGISTTGIQLLIFRIIQSIGGALLLANSVPIVTDAFPKNELGKALGINTMVVSVGAVIGSILGGALLVFGWRSTFYINVPIGIVGTIWSALQLREVDFLPKNQKFDFKGTFVFSIGMLLFLISLSLVRYTGWTPTIISLLLISFVIMFIFVRIEIKAEYPMLDMGLLKTRILAFAYCSNFFSSVSRGAVSYLLVFYFQGIKGYSSMLSGLLLAPLALSILVLSPISGHLSDKYGSKNLSTVGLLISAVGLLFLMRLSPSTSMMELSIYLIIIGIGSGIFISPNTSCIMKSVPDDKRGVAGGVRTMMINSGTVISIALSLSVLSTTVPNDTMQALMEGVNVGSDSVGTNEFLYGLKICFLISCVISVLAAFMSSMRGTNLPSNAENKKIKSVKCKLEG
ncbi:MAG: MFS transporter [Clostridiaceae bacterium]